VSLEDLLDAWRANCAINHELLAGCSDDDFDLKPGKGKTIRSNFVHIVGVRRAHLETKLREETLQVAKLDWQSASRQEIEDALRHTDLLMTRYFELLEGSKRPGNWTTARFFAYNIAHEAHHRSQIEIALRLNGREPSDTFLYGLWEWPKK
jgi:uncharacterized damage-inducible protein DinB